MDDKFQTHHIILVISSRRGVISIAIGGSGSRGTNEVTILIVIIVVFRISTAVVVVAVGIIIGVFFSLLLMELTRVSFLALRLVAVLGLLPGRALL